MGVLTFHRSSFILNICSCGQLKLWLNDWEESALLHDLLKLSLTFTQKLNLKGLIMRLWSGVPRSSRSSWSSRLVSAHAFNLTHTQKWDYLQLQNEIKQTIKDIKDNYLQ